MLIPSNVTVEEYNEAVALEEASHARVHFLFDDVTFQDEELYQGGITVSTYMNPSNSMKFGTAYSTEVVVNFLKGDKTENLNFAREFTLEFGVDIGEDVEWITIGHFIGKSATETSYGTIELVAYDKMPRLDVSINEFLNALTFPCTLSDIFDELCTYFVITPISGDEIPDVMERTVSSLDDVPINTCRDLLCLIAEANGCYAKITNEGFLQLKWFHDHTSEQELLRDNCFSYKLIKLEKTYSKKWAVLEDFQWKDLEYVKYSDYDNNNNPFQITHMTALWNDPRKEVTQPPYDEFADYRTWASAENFTWESLESYMWKEFEQADDIGGSIYTISDNQFLMYSTDEEIKAHLQLILDRLYNFALYYVATVQMVGNWLIEPGDIVRLEIGDGEFTTYPIFNRVLQWNGSCQCSYETTGSLTAG